MEEPLMQVIVVRRDLDWPVGAIATQAVHASTKAMALFRSHPETQAFVASEAALQAMHVCIYEAKSLAKLQNLHAKFTAAGIDACLWTEQPEDVTIALATRPAPKSALRAVTKSLRLFQ
jgi:peptidyl-tRNA hydrolase